jgi:hypothetical protein
MTPAMKEMEQSGTDHLLVSERPDIPDIRGLSPIVSRSTKATQMVSSQGQTSAESAIVR